MFNTKISFTIGLSTRGGKELAPHQVAAGIVAQELAGCFIDGFTVVNNLGYWQGQPECSLTVSVLLHCEHPAADPRAVEALAKRFAQACDQTCVLWEISPVVGGLAYNPVKGA